VPLSIILKKPKAIATPHSRGEQKTVTTKLLSFDTAQNLQWKDADLFDKKTVTNHEIGSIWLIY
jgi:hypothetical protein